MATQMVSQPSGSNLFCNSGSFGMGDMYGLHDLSKAEMAAPRLIMLANVALTGEVPNSCCDYSLDEDRQMAELKTVYENSFSDSDGERMELEESNEASEPDLFDAMEMEPSEVQEEKVCDQQTTPPETRAEVEPEKKSETAPSRTEDKTKCVKSKPFRCRPCQYKAESEEEFVHHIKDHSAKRFIDHDSNKNAQDSGSCSPEEVDFSKGPIRCDRCGYNTNRFDHYLAHLKHHNKVSDNERVYKCTICTYTTVSEYHWKKHLRNHFPRIVYTCSQCSYFSDRKNNYIQHIRTHTGERPYQCGMCPYSSSQKTHLTRHMRTHSGEKPFKCEQCSYVASNQHEVTRHARQVHNGPKPLTCPHCNYKTADRSNFKKHVELHVNPRQFLCPVCDYAASKKCNLQYHIKSRHSGCADITMDVSKVKLRTKKGDAAGSDVNSNDQEVNESSDLKSEPPEKKSEGKPKVEKEKCAKVKQAATPPVGQITTRSHKPPSSKTGEDANPDKVKCAKRKSGVLSEKPLKINDTQITNVKKRRLAQKSNHAQDIPRKANGAGKTAKRKVSMKKANHKKPLKNKNKKTTISHKTAISKKKSSKSTTTKDSETGKSKSPVDEIADVPLAGQSPESVTEPTQEEVTSLATSIDGSDLGAESKTEESTVSDVAIPDPSIDSCSSSSEITPEADRLLLEKDSAIDKDSELEPKDSGIDKDSELEPKDSGITKDSELEPKDSGIDKDSELEPKDSGIGKDSELEPKDSGITKDSELEPMDLGIAKDGELEPKDSGIDKDSELEPKDSGIGKDSELEPKDSGITKDSELEPMDLGIAKDGELEPKDSGIDKDSELEHKDSNIDKDSELEPKDSGIDKDGELEPKDSDIDKDSELEPKDSNIDKYSELEPKDSNIDKYSELEPNSVTSLVPVDPILESQSTLDIQPLTDTSPAEAPESIPEVDCNHEVSGLICSDSPSEESENVKESASNNGSMEESEVLRQTNPSDTEQFLCTTITQNTKDCDPKESVLTPCETPSHEPVDIEEDEGIHSHEGSDISDNVSERSDDSGLNGLQSPQETLESQPLLEVPSVSTSVSNESYVCIFCDRVFRKAEEYTKHLKRHLVNVYYLEKAAQNQL